MTMRSIRQVLVGAATVVAAACFTGPSAASYAPAHSPAGAKVKLKLTKGSMRGELLEVRDSALVVWNGCHMSVVLFGAIKKASFGGPDTYYDGGQPARESLLLMRMLSRFPGGMPKGVEAELLRCSGEAAPAVVSR
jgi:hypothetical protein